jgi:hypothetical protein
VKTELDRKEALALLDEITEGWETVERNLLMQQSNRFTPDVFTFWTANRSVEPAV